MPGVLCSTNPSGRAAAEAGGYVAHVRRIGEEKLDEKKQRRHPARRWVAERAGAWLNRCRAILVRYAKKSSNYLGLIQLAVSLLWYPIRPMHARIEAPLPPDGLGRHGPIPLQLERYGSVALLVFLRWLSFSSSPAGHTSFQLQPATATNQYADALIPPAFRAYEFEPNPGPGHALTSSNLPPGPFGYPGPCGTVSHLTGSRHSMSTSNQPQSASHPPMLTSIARQIAAAKIFLNHAPALNAVAEGGALRQILVAARLTNNQELRARELSKYVERRRRRREIYQALRPTFGPLREAFQLCQVTCRGFEAVATGATGGGALYAASEIEVLLKRLEARHAEMEFTAPPPPPPLEKPAAQILLALAVGGYIMLQVDIQADTGLSIRACRDHLDTLIEMGLVKEAGKGRGYVITDAGRAAARSIRIPPRENSV